MRGGQAVFVGVEVEEMLGEQRNVFAAGAQRRQVDGDDVEAVEKIFAEAAIAHGLAQIDVGGGEDAHIHLNLLNAAEVHEAAVLQHAQNLGLRVHAHGGDLVEEERAAVGDFEEALLGRDGRSERALDVAEERGLEQLRRHGAGVDGHKGLVAARRVGVNGLGDELLAGAAFALNQNRGAAGRDLRHQVEDAQHDLALAHDVGEVVALLERALELQILFFGAVAGDGRANVGQQLFVVPRLLNKVFRAGADGLDHVVHRAVGGDHDDRQFGLALFDLRQQFQAALAGQGKVEKHQVKVLQFQNAQALFALVGHSYRISLEREQHFKRLADAGLVVNDKNARGELLPVKGAGCGRRGLADSKAVRPQACTEFLNSGNSR